MSNSLDIDSSLSTRLQPQPRVGIGLLVPQIEAHCLLNYCGELCLFLANINPSAAGMPAMLGPVR